MRSNGKVAAIIQARMGSSRLPGKMLKPIMGRPVLGYMVERVRRSRLLDDVVVATSTNPQDDQIEAFCAANGVSVFRGSEDDVLSRIVGAIKAYDIEVQVELYGDCPLMDPEVIDRLIEVFLQGDYDCVFNALKATYPSGLQAKVLRAAIYVDQERVLTEWKYRESPALCIRDFLDKFRVTNVQAPPEVAQPDVYIELDTEEDFVVIRSILEALYPKKPDFSTVDVLRFLAKNPDLRRLNQGVVRQWKAVIKDV